MLSMSLFLKRIRCSPQAIYIWVRHRTMSDLELMSSARIINNETKILMMINMRIIYAKYCFKYLTWMNSFNFYHNPAKLNIIIHPPLFFYLLAKLRLRETRVHVARGYGTVIYKKLWLWRHRGAWQTAVHGVAKSQTRLRLNNNSDLTLAPGFFLPKAG